MSRKDAFNRGLKKFFTGKFCKNGHLSERYTVSGSCDKCYRAYIPVSKHNPMNTRRLELFYYTDADRQMLEDLAKALLEASKPTEANGAAIREEIYRNVPLIDTAQDRRDNAPSRTPLKPFNY